MSKIDFKRADYEQSLPLVTKTRAAATGDVQDQLIQPNPSDKSYENVLRFKQYKERAVYYNATGRTLDAMDGAVFRQEPEIVLPSSLDYLLDDADGKGLGLIQQSKRCLDELAQTGRVGLLVDFPAVDGSTVAENQQANILLYKHESIINWVYSTQLDLVILHEVTDIGTPFEPEVIDQWRELGLAEGQYYQLVWRKDERGNFIIHQSFIPLDGKGNTMYFIPFQFVGAVNNDAQIDSPALSDLAVLNIAHYRNSADYEESAYLVGQPHLLFTGLTENWVKDQLDGKVILGSRAATLLPRDADGKILQVAPNMISKEAMDHKEKQMITLGARIFERGGAPVTASQVQAEVSADHSVLSLLAANVSAAFETAIEWVALFMNVTGTITFDLNQEFLEAKLSAQDRAVLLQELLSGAITRETYNENMRRAGIVSKDLTDEEIDALLDDDSVDDDGIDLDGE